MKENEEKDERSEKVLLVSHCILNVNTKYKGGAKNYSNFVREIIDFSEEYDLGIEQLPCPEIGLYQVRRESATRDFYDEADFKKVCRNYANFTQKIVKKLKKGNIEPFAVIGVSRSPSCGVKRTTVGSKYKEKTISGKGLFVKELQKKFRSEGWNIPFVDFDFKKPEESMEKIEKLVSKK